MPSENMSIRLLPVTANNIGLYDEFDNQFEGNLNKYQSRIKPSNCNSSCLLWYYIAVNDVYIGSVWLEKENACDSFAKLGIFIADENYRGNDFGTQAIIKIMKLSSKLKIDKAILNVRANNQRAIRCYEKCGFVKTQTFIKSNINVIRMEVVL